MLLVISVIAKCDHGMVCDLGLGFLQVVFSAT